jgi:hypothetical protein
MGLIVVWPGEILRPRHEQERTLDGRIVGIGAVVAGNGEVRYA